MSTEPNLDDRGPQVDPEDFLRALMKISPEDAEKAREQSPATRPRRPKREADAGRQDSGGT